MDPQREEIPRIAVDSLEDWYRIKESYTKATMGAFEKRVASTPRSTQDIERLREHLKQVSRLALRFLFDHASVC